MYKNFSLTESEREQILNNHKEHGYKQPINEQGGADRMPFVFIFKKLEKQRPGTFRMATEQGTGYQYIIGKTQTTDNPFVEYHPDYDENEGATNFIYAYGIRVGKRKEYHNRYQDPSEVSSEVLNEIVEFMLEHGPQSVTPPTQSQQTTASVQGQQPVQQKPLNEGKEILKDVFKSLIK